MEETEHNGIEPTPAESARQEFSRLIEAYEDEAGRLRRQLASVQRRYAAQTLICEAARAALAELNTEADDAA